MGVGALLLLLKIKGAQLSQNSWFSSGLSKLLLQRLPYTPIYIAMFTSDAFLAYILQFVTYRICSLL